MKYLAIDFGGVLDGVCSVEKPSDGDILLSQIDHNLFQVLKDGVKVVNQLCALVDKHGHKLVSHSKSKEADQIEFLDKLNKACKKRGLTFPKFTAMPVRDPSQYKGIKSTSPVFVKNRSHGIWIAGYEKELDGKACVRNAFSQLLDIPETSRRHHIILDDGPSITERAKLEGWQAHLVGEMSLAEIISKIYEGALQEEIPQVVFQSSLHSRDKFKAFSQEVKGGSSDSIQLFIKLCNGTKWVGKCGGVAICVQKNDGSLAKPDPINEYKEYLAGRLYACFGVNVPDLTISHQILSDKAQKIYKVFFDDYKQISHQLPSDLPDIHEPRPHLMSCFIDGFTELGENFLKDYQTQSKECYYKVQGLPLRGFGRALAVATLLYDYDCIGNSGGNMGYVITPLHAEIVKIDTGEALPFVSDLDKGLVHDPESRDMLIGTQGFKISYEQLNKADQREFVLTVKQILEFPEEKLKDIFEELINQDKRFERVLSLLLERKSQFLNAFSPEVRKLLIQQIYQTEAEQAEKIRLSWSHNLGSQGHSQDLLEAHLSVLSLQNTSNKNFFGVPARNELFVGREQDIEKISKMFESSRVACLVGSGGLGKTSLAVEYGYQNYQTKYTQVIWLYAEHNNILSAQMQKYLEEGHAMKLEGKKQNEITEEFYALLAKEKTCVIIDNVQNLESIDPYIPQGLHNTLDILITSRFRSWEYPVLNLSTFDTQLALAYLEKKVGKKFDVKEVHKLTEKLGGLPLGIAQVAGYIKAHNLSLFAYCTLFDREQAMILSQGGSDNKTVATTLTLALNELKRKNSLVDTILSFVAYVSPDNITLSLLESFCNKSQSQNVFGKFATAFTGSKTSTIEYAIQLLLDYSIFSSDNGRLRIHRMTQAVVRSIHRKNRTFRKQHKKVIDWLLPLMDYRDTDLEKIAQISTLIPHGLTLSEIENNKIDFTVYYNLLTKIGYHQQYGVHNSETSKVCFEKALIMTEKHHGEEHYETGKILIHLGNTYGTLGDYKKKKKLQSRALKIMEKCCGEHHPETASALTNLSSAYSKLGNYKKQINLLVRALSIKEKHYGVNHPSISVTRANLGNAYGSLGNYKEKKEELTRVLAIDEKYYGKSHPEIASTLTNLGNAYGDLGDYQKQRELLTRALDIKNKHYGKDNPSTAITLSNLGNAYGGLGDFDQQREVLTLALTIKEKYFGKDHPVTASTLTNFGIAYNWSGDYEKSKEFLSRALVINEKHYGKYHPETATILTYLGSTYGSLGQIEEQRELLVRALAIRERHYGLEHSKTSITLSYLGVAYFNTKDFAKSYDLQKQAHDILSGFYDANNHYTKYSRIALKEVEMAIQNISQ